MSKPLIERRKDYRGRALFVVAEMLSTYDEAEAEALADTNVHEILCPVAHEVARCGVPCPARIEVLPTAPNGRGVLTKYDWE